MHRFSSESILQNTSRQFVVSIADSGAAIGSPYYIVFAIFCVLNYVFPLANHNYLLSTESVFDIRLILYSVAILLCITILMRRHIKRFSEQGFLLYWLFTLFYCLPFMSIFLFFQSEGSLGWAANMIFAIMLLASLVDWVLFLSFTVLGAIFAGILHFILLSNPFSIFSLQMGIVVYSVLLSLLIGGLFIRNRQIQQEERVSMMKLFSGAIAHELRSPLAATQMHADLINSVLEDNSNNEGKLENSSVKILKDSAKHLDYISCRGLKTIDMLLSAVRDSLLFEDEAFYSIKECVAEAVQEYTEAYLKTQKQITITQDSVDFDFRGSKIFTKQMLHNLFDNAFKHGGSKVEIKITYKDHMLSCTDNGKGIDERKIKNIFKKFYTDSSTGTGIGLSFCQSVMQKLGGHIECKSVVGKYTTFTLFFKEGLDD